MPASTPISRSKTAALTRILDAAGRGYHRFTSGQVPAEKAIALIHKLHQRHSIGPTPAERLTRKKNGKANAILCFYLPEDAQVAQWLMLFTDGELDSPEKLGEIASKPRLQWLDYELIRRANRGVTSWTWRRPKSEMTEHYLMLGDMLARRRQDQVCDPLARIANQPGFHGVREQSWSLCQYARQHGYTGDLPFVHFLRKVGHGERVML